jgi:hypothetical protein
MARSNRGLLLVFLVCFLIGSITLPSAQGLGPQEPQKEIEEEEIGPEIELVSTAVPEETNKISIPFLSKLTKQDAKKIAAFSLGAWGAATGVGWAMQQFGGDSD